MGVPNGDGRELGGRGGSGWIRKRERAGHEGETKRAERKGEWGTGSALRGVMI